MKRTTVLNKFQDEQSQGTYTKAYLHESPFYLHNYAGSDSESLSDSSKKISKKRCAYQKISDEIRVNLLEAVQNGETLKSAAKRHKINYSSAKSILHTYRKEGRILKKSAQERNIKKKASIDPETEEYAKPIQKENELYDDLPKEMFSLTERARSDTYHTVTTEDTNSIGSMNEIKNSPGSRTNIESEKDNEEVPRKDFELSHIPLQNGNQISSFLDNRSVAFIESSLFEDNEPQFLDFEAPCSKSSFILSEFDSFHRDLVQDFPNKTCYKESQYAFTYDKGLGEDDLGLKAYNERNYEQNGESALSCSLQSFMDTQKLFQEALRNSSTNYTGDNKENRKGSLDFFL